MKTNFTSSKQILRNLIIITALMLLTISQLVAQSKHIVEVTQNVFTPDSLEIIAGDTVEWRNTDGFHNVNGTTDTYPSNPESFGNSTGNGWTYSHVFTIAGEYDYQCDPHVGLGMVGKIVVNEADDNGEKHMLTINFTEMNPHIGQNLHLAVIEKNSGMEISRLDTIAEEEFMVHVYGIENEMSYNVDFFADHNSNGIYDAPPTDHAWRLDLDDVMGDTTLNFVHNTDFTDIFEITSITEKDINRLKLYPNPATDVVSIELNEQNLRDFTLSVYDIAGKLNQIEPIHSNNKIEFSVLHLQRGMYFIELKSNSLRETMKLIKK